MFHRLLPLLPRARWWIRRTLRQHADDARPVAAFGHARLVDFFATDLLRRARVVVVDSVPQPPLQEWGLSELDDLAAGEADGITFRDTFFIRADREADESIFFHELVHVVQWQHLGINAFLLLYGLGLVEYGPIDSPLEQIAYDCQGRFDASVPPFDVAASVRAHADELVREFRGESRLLWALLPLLRLG